MSSINFESTYGVITIQDMNVVSVDANYARIYGYQSPEELLSNIDSFLDLISEDYHVLAYQNYLETVSGQRDPQVHTYTNVDRNGREFTVFSIDHVTEWQEDLHCKSRLSIFPLRFSYKMRCVSKIRCITI